MDTKIGSKLRRRPPPLQISGGFEAATLSPGLASATSSLGFGGLLTPKTPTDRRKHSLLGVDIKGGSSPIAMRYNPAAPTTPGVPLPEAPASPTSPYSPTAAELPGSLLLASQGFPQTNPISPPPSLRLLRRTTDDSIISSVPTLSTSASTDDDDGTMEALRNLTTPLRKHDRSAHSTMPSYTIGSRVPADAHITQPFTAMTIEELLDKLPECDHVTISQHWLPAMRNHLQQMTSLLNEACDLKLESSVSQVNLSSVRGAIFGDSPSTNIAQALKSFSDQLRMITAEYRKIVESAESLAERDTKASHEQLNELEGQVEEALQKMAVKDKKIEDKDRRISELRNTVHEVTRLLGTFIQNNIPSWVDTIREPRTVQVLRIIDDYTRNEPHGSVDYVRVAEDTLDKYVGDLREARSLIGEYRKVLHGQGAMIRDQTKSLDATVDKYGKAIRLIQEKDHEVLLLVQQNNDLSKQLQECRAALAEDQQARSESEKMARRYEELRGAMISLQTSHTLEIDQRDAEILNLRQKLGSAREEVFARREDVKNVMSQAHAMLHASTDSIPVAAKNSNTSKALRFFGMERDKEKYRKGIPTSHSMIGLPSSDSRFSSKEVATAVDRTALRHRPSLQAHTNPRALTTPNTPIDSSQRPKEPLLTAPTTRQRSDSLGATQRHGVLNASPIDSDKSLPYPPAHPRPYLPAARVAEIAPSIESPLAAQITSDYLKEGIMGQTAARRVLSKITEVSSPASTLQTERVPDENQSDHSVASSDREAYRRSICALDILNSSSGLPYSEIETDIERIIRGGQPRSPPEPNSFQSYSGFEANDNGERQRRQDEYDEEQVYTGVARVLHLRPGTRDLRGASARSSESEHHSYESDFGREGRRERFRESMVSNESGYRTEDSEPKTVAQMYHQGRRHIRG
ncbi:uncharacterized protein Z520_01598 [Fonsecaea multimorphosa CBS 102226]|uniref:Uncharacterized protein n=1 Tax=Fonsecaea multimorphosa CBS 102226 TaxID=1442371 RepID=A0A0D2HMM6_9EURO|nr:uncharacterized protein Z520_01598 [Fonsecaea multimorphosa CBS 102226]KIY03131.1 hypothetical protein Z520_01598 [Fonsecaea multimorphosa CBS 102226]OAL30377.1 hypothetical protein AYO22_01575 [Fonsecaea multimorphosa]